jgi:Leucine-rich repeat (LRR) protein
VDGPVADLTGIHCLDNLKSMDLYSDLVEDLTPLVSLSKLENLGIDGPFEDMSPIIGLTKLRTIHFHSNNISDLSPLVDLVNLQYVAITSNNVSDISPLVENEGIGNGDTVRIDGNPLDCEDQTTLDHLWTLIQRGVELDHDCW